ncbi:phospho-glucose isomerase C-terminal SIS domain-containing protein [Kytococcus aerolatus]|uniref:Phospho-glucose isomerase C-terminal SIS domain-containing protein n=1 Tax=Kytococcus aerolatus TaxID=592308 RepID=A0A212TZQ3_9MICO|nr:SIS domain-containing protein [Kytococcus aerolatus]SNC71468.1 phospho-glucose isomerase C-terminal SIS domain-containing protein [Kytococcus aerolatus]
MPYIDDALLDDPDHLARCDRRGVLRSLATAGAQVRQAVTLADEAGIERIASAHRPRAVVVVASGGSAVVGDVVSLLVEQGSPTPVHALQGGPLPAWVGPLDLVVALSLSGAEAGAVTIAHEAARRGAAVLTVGAADSPLADAAQRARGVHVPVGHGPVSSRTALWGLVSPVAVALGHVGLVQPGTIAWEEVARALDRVAEECRPDSPAFVNPAKVHALALAETLPMVLADGPVAGVAARRAGSMLARTARVPATVGELPHAASEVVACFDGPHATGAGWEATRAPVPDGGRDIFADPFLDAPAQIPLGLWVLGAGGLSPMAQRVSTVAQRAGVRLVDTLVEEAAPLEELARLVARVDFTATWLAIGLGLDPGVSPHLAELRESD